MNNKEKLKNMILEMFPDLAEESSVKVEEVKEEISNLKAQNSDLKAQIEALENAPVQKGNVTVPGNAKPTEVMYKKKYLPGQGETLQLSHTPEKQEVLAKGYIDFVEKTLKNGQASLKATMNETTAGEGGYLVFDEYVNEILAFARLNSWSLNACRVISVGSDRIHIPAEENSVTVAFKAEKIAADQTEPTVTEVQLDPERLTAYSILTNELLEDSEFDLVSWLTGLFAEAIGQKIDDQVINGLSTTASPFEGILNNASIVDSTGILDMAHIADVVTKLPVNKAVGAGFLFHRLVYKSILTMVDSAGNAVFPPSVATPNSLWGYPVTLAETAPSTLTGGLPVGIFGNWNNYIIAMRKMAGALDVDIYSKFIENMSTFRTVTRVHGKVWNGSGFVQLIY